MSKLFLNRRTGGLQIFEEITNGTEIINEISSLDPSVIDSTIDEFLETLGKIPMAKKIILVGAGASGKDVYKTRLLKKGLSSDVSYTTREIRDGEINGVDYNFISSEEFKMMIDHNQFLQWNEFGGKYYGTHKESIKSNDVFIMTPSALKHIGEFGRENFYIIFFDIPSTIRIKRLIERGMDDEAIRKRLDEDEETFSNFDNFDRIITEPTFLSWK